MKLLIPISICLLGILVLTIPDLSSDKDNYEEEKILTVMRKIGHELLASVGDNHSRILPVEKANRSTYVIKFETAFQFETPQLASIVQKNISAASLSSQYIVSVRDCHKNSVLYSYEFTPQVDMDSLPCLTRENDYGCYSIMISFADTNYNIFNKKFLAFSIPLAVLSLIGFVYFRKKDSAVHNPVSLQSEPDVLKIDGIIFNTRARVLMYGDRQIELTEKETRILSIFAARPNEIIERDQLLKEVWEDEGVFVGRSLDVFVSRLRKKLEINKNVNLVNVHGRGYKLEVAL